MKQIKISVFLLLLSTTVFAQDIVSFGFKAGLNFSNIDGDIETDQSGNELEEYNMTQGFNVGAIVNFRLTDYFGLRTELLYNQKGTQYNFQGPSYFVFDPQGERIINSGTRDMQLEISNSYLEIPLLGYAKVGKFEVMGGMYASVLLSSSASGNLTYSSDEFRGSDFEELSFALDYSYYRDEPGEFASDVRIVTVGGRRVEVPNTLNAYYEERADERLFKTLDFGLIGGFSFYLNQGLFLNARIEYGLSDITNNDADRSFSSLEGNNFLFRNDNDRNLSLHTAIGFRF